MLAGMLAALLALGGPGPVLAFSAAADTPAPQGSAPRPSPAQPPAPAAPAASPAGTINLAPINVGPAGKPAAAPSAPATTQAQGKEEKPLPRVSAGLLECRSAFATGTGFGSSRKVSCEFRSARGINHYYTGTLERVGLDLGISDQASMLWAVLSTSPDLAPGALSGTYMGMTSGFALGPGFSANVLAAKDASKNVTLQPVSVSADSGLSISLAAATLTLNTAEPPKVR